MGFFNFLLIIILVFWIIALQSKIDKLIDTLRYVCKKINDYEKIAFITPSSEVEKKQPATPEPVAKPVQPAATVQAPIRPEKPVVQPQINEPKVETPKVKPVYVEQTKKEEFDIQKALLGNVFNKIGALAIIIAVIILIKLVSQFIVITPVMKFAFGIILGTGFMFAGSVMHKKDHMKNFSEVLLGTGFATYFITTFCGSTVLDLYGSVAALIMGGVLLLLTYSVSNKLKTPSMIVIGLIGGYLTPLFAEANKGEVFGFLIFLNILSLIFTLRNKHYNVINTLNIVLSMLIMSVIYLYNAFISKGSELSYVYPLVLWGSYVLYDLLRDKTNVLDNVLSWANYVLLTTFSLLLFHNAHDKLSLLFIVTAVIYLLLAGSSRFAKNSLYKTYEYFVMLNVWLYIMFMFNDVQSIMAWSFVALAVSVFVATFRLNYLLPAIVAYFSTTFIGALIAHSAGEYCFLAKYSPMINPRTLVFIVPVITMLFSAKLIRTFETKSANWLRFTGVSLLYLFVIGEINSYFLSAHGNADYINFNRLMILAIIGFVYSLNMKKFANIAKSVLFNVASICTFIFTVLLLICSSYWYPDAFLPILNLRFAAYLLAIIACVLYDRWDKVDFFKYIAVFLGFLLCHSESASIQKLYGAGWQYLISLSWVLYSGITTIIGIVKNRRYLINTGIGIIFLTIGRIFIYDLAKVDALYKLVAFLALGIILMLVSYIYTVNKNKK